jgi:ribosome biogenesis SPOUT family RNA methylase Rps3
MTTTDTTKTYIVEHLDPELGPWSELEYLAIARESHAAGARFLLTSLPAGFRVPEALAAAPAFQPESRGVEELYAADKSRVCLLDPAAQKDLAPEDGEKFDVFLFGGILGMCVWKKGFSRLVAGGWLGVLTL